jgi:hypothetical protein
MLKFSIAYYIKNASPDADLESVAKKLQENNSTKNALGHKRVGFSAFNSVWKTSPQAQKRILQIKNFNCTLYGETFIHI